MENIPEAGTPGEDSLKFFTAGLSRQAMIYVPRTWRERELPGRFQRKLAPNSNMKITAKTLIICHFSPAILNW